MTRNGRWDTWALGNWSVFYATDCSRWHVILLLGIGTSRLRDCALYLTFQKSTMLAELVDLCIEFYWWWYLDLSRYSFTCWCIRMADIIVKIHTIKVTQLLFSNMWCTDQLCLHHQIHHHHCLFKTLPSVCDAVFHVNFSCLAINCRAAELKQVHCICMSSLCRYASRFLRGFTVAVMLPPVIFLQRLHVVSI